MIAAVNKAIRVTENTATALDHLITISVLTMDSKVS